MNWDDDIDFMANKKSAAKQGRRAGVESEDSQKSTRLPLKAGKWADEGNKSGRKNSTNLIEQERFQDNRAIDSDNDDIPIIPDIDEFQDDIGSLQEVKQPMVLVNKATYKELDKELVSLQSGENIANLGNINLSFLTNKLYPEKDVKEVDELWSMDALFEHLINYNK
ncbi:PREDICTED: intraflagellar transport protein 43 homolog [Nicrophorus vespilloides]|uniref:Intraflagellar transport protein 43 homolog n=1 Tax=Nicrophorus vespilloides TaxID=110193 RepID=A0ABM1M7X4_NICVS|nr:PREDICTED: intraflagellar transport protein 43 homolog [Nicrophorus vespilloides]